MTDDYYHTNLIALEAYAKQITDNFKFITSTVEHCPHCSRIAAKVTSTGTSPSWVDAVCGIPGHFMPLRYCTQDMLTGNVAITDDVGIRTESNWYPAKEELQSQPQGQQLCTCDYDTVVRITGCKCGGK